MTMIDKVELAQAKVEALEAELEQERLAEAKLSAEVEEMKARLENTRRRIKSLSEPGSQWRSPGLIKRAKQEVMQARIEAQDLEKPKVIWHTSPVYDADRVITRITPKRIYLRTPGESRDDPFDLASGMRCDWSGYGVIDVDASVAAFRAWEESNKAKVKS